MSENKVVKQTEAWIILPSGEKIPLPIPDKPYQTFLDEKRGILVTLRGTQKTPKATK